MGYPPAGLYTDKWVEGGNLEASHLKDEFISGVYARFTLDNFDDDSPTVASMQATVDPYPSGAESLPVSSQGELRRLRYLIAQITGKTYWYQDPTASLETIMADDSLSMSQLKSIRAKAQSTPNMTVVVNAGIFMKIGGDGHVNYAGGNSPAITAPTTNPRIALLTIDNSGVLAWTYGSEAASPSAPTYPTDKVSICEVYQRVGMVSIKNTDDTSNGYILRDVRQFFRPPITTAIRETGGANLDLSTIANGQLLKRDGSTVKGSFPKIYFAQAISGSTSSLGYVAIGAGVSITFTPQHATNIIIIDAILNNTGMSVVVTLGLFQDGSLVGNAEASDELAGKNVISLPWRIQDLSATSHTFELKWKVSGATVDLVSGGAILRILEIS